MKLSSDEIVKVLNIVIGNTQACGMDRIDNDVFQNVGILAEVTATLVEWLKLSAESFNSSTISERKVGEAAMSALIEIENGIGEWLDEN